MKQQSSSLLLLHTSLLDLAERKLGLFFDFQGDFVNCLFIMQFFVTFGQKCCDCEICRTCDDPWLGKRVVG